MKLMNRRLLSRIVVAVLAVATLGVSLPVTAIAAPSSTSAVNAYTCTWYLIRRGDTLTKISRRYGVTIRAIMAANGMRSTRIYAGRYLCIPIPVTNPPPPTGGGPWYAQFWNNTVQSGSPALVRNDASVNFNWGFGTPD